MRVVLHVRAFERALPRTGGEHWNDAVKRYFREFWALDSFASALFEIAHASSSSSAGTPSTSSIASSSGWSATASDPR